MRFPLVSDQDGQDHKSISERQLRLRSLKIKAMLRWFGHVKRRDSGYIEQNDGDGGARKEEKRTTMKVHECSEGGHENDWDDRKEARDRMRWRKIICHGDP